MNKKISRGFSLAEALIAVAIIGIIAAITIPTVVANYNQKAFFFLKTMKQNTHCYFIYTNKTIHFLYLFFLF